MTKNSTVSSEVIENEDDFFGDFLNEGVDPNPRIRQPYVIARNKSQKPSWILTKNCARDCGWKNYRNEQWSEHEFGGMTVEPVIYIPQPWVLILHATPLYATEKDTGNLLGKVNWEEYVHDSEENKLQRNFLMLLLSNNYQPLHTKPLQYKASGVAGASFSKALIGGKDSIKNKSSEGFYRELESAIFERFERDEAAKQVKNPSYEPRMFQMGRTNFDSTEFAEHPWHNVSVFKPVFKPELRQNPNNPNEQTVVCYTDAWEKPTVENCYEFWRKDLKALVNDLTTQALGKNWGKRFMEPARKVEVLPFDNNSVSTGGLFV